MDAERESLRDKLPTNRNQNIDVLHTCPMGHGIDRFTLHDLTHQGSTCTVLGTVMAGK